MIERKDADSSCRHAVRLDGTDQHACAQGPGGDHERHRDGAREMFGAAMGFKQQDLAREDGTHPDHQEDDAAEGQERGEAYPEGILEDGIAGDGEKDEGNSADQVRPLP
jgi:hypothetical protein